MTCWDRRLILATQRNARAVSWYEKGVLEGGGVKKLLGCGSEEGEMSAHGRSFQSTHKQATPRANTRFLKATTITKVCSEELS